MTRWKKVTDGLPEKGSPVWIFDGENIYPGFYDLQDVNAPWKGEHFVDWGNSERGAITHWLPWRWPEAPPKKMTKDEALAFALKVIEGTEDSFYAAERIREAMMEPPRIVQHPTDDGRRLITSACDNG